MGAQTLIGSDAWLVTGNAGTTSTTNFIGTTDAADFVAKTNNTERARITAASGDLLLSGNGTANNSGLVFNNLNANSPISAGATLGVDANGRVVTVTGSSFTPAYGQVVLSSTIGNIAVGATADLLQITLPVPGTYLIIYNVRVETSVFVAVGGSAHGTVFLKDGTGAEIPNTRILAVQFQPSAASASAQSGGTGSGTLVRTVTDPSGETLTLSLINTSPSGNTPISAYSNFAGMTQLSYVKITP